MNQNRLFQQTRRQLATWFVVVMVSIMIVCEVSLDRTLTHLHKLTIDRELISTANTIHNGFSTFLDVPGELEPKALNLLPDLCLYSDRCYDTKVSEQLPVEIIYKVEYYVRILDTEGKPVAIAGKRIKSLPIDASNSEWSDLLDEDGYPYRQISLPLHTQNNKIWGYLQVGRSVEEVKEYLGIFRRILIWGFPFAVTLIGFGAWWTVGKAMMPIYRSYRQIQQFTADAAHELRTPLAAIRATVESSLMKPVLDEINTRSTLETIARQNQRLSQIVSDLMILSRLDRQLSGWRTFAFDKLVILNDLVHDLAEEFAALAIASNLRLQLQINVPEAIEVKGNSEQLYKLVSNLVVNAINYTSPEGVVTIVLEATRTEAIIKVRDTGMGIVKPEQKRIFDRFYRVDSGRSRQTGGSGLGLAIARAIVLSHQGTIEVTSELGVGSTFTVKLPRLDN